MKHAEKVMKAVGCGNDKWSTVIFLNLHILSGWTSSPNPGKWSNSLYWQKWVYTNFSHTYQFSFSSKAIFKAEKDHHELLCTNAKASIKEKTKSLASMKIMKFRSALILNSGIESKRRQSDKSYWNRISSVNTYCNCILLRKRKFFLPVLVCTILNDVWNFILLVLLMLIASKVNRILYSSFLSCFAKWINVNVLKAKTRQKNSSRFQNEK